MRKSSPLIGEVSSGEHSSRPIEKELQSSFDRRIAMSKVGELKGSNVIVKTQIGWHDRQIEKTLFILRYNLVKNGIDKLKVCTWNLSPFLRGEGNWPQSRPERHQLLLELTLHCCFLTILSSSLAFVIKIMSAQLQRTKIIAQSFYLLDYLLVNSLNLIFFFFIKQNRGVLLLSHVGQSIGWLMIPHCDTLLHRINFLKKRHYSPIRAA